MQLAARFDTSDSKKCVIVDKLQLIHTVHNLAEVLEHTPSVPPTLRDSNLKQYTRELQETYVEKYISQVKYLKFRLIWIYLYLVFIVIYK